LTGETRSTTLPSVFILLTRWLEPIDNPASLSFH
jgi:hypothetical protein